MQGQRYSNTTMSHGMVLSILVHCGCHPHLFCPVDGGRIHSDKPATLQTTTAFLQDCVCESLPCVYCTLTITYHFRHYMSQVIQEMRHTASESETRRTTVIIIPKPTLLDVNPFGLSTIWVVVFLVCIALSLAWHGYFYCICALHIIVNNDILQRVLRAVTKNGIVINLYSSNNSLLII